MIKEITGDTLTKRSTSQGKVATSPRSKLKRDDLVLPKPTSNKHDRIPLAMSEEKESKATRKQKQGSLKRFLSPRSYSLGTRKKSTSSSFEVIDSSSVDDVQSSDHSDEDYKKSLSRKERESGSGKEEYEKKRKGKSPPCGTTYDDWDDKTDESAHSAEKLRTKAMRSKSERKYEKLRIVDKSDKSDKSEFRSEFISERGLENDERDETETDRETERETDERDVEEQEPFVITIEDTPQNNQSIAVIQAIIRRVNAEMELDCRIQFQIQRTHIFFEIVDTEETYFAGLTSLIEEIYEPVLATQKSSEPILEPSVFKSLFPEGHVKIIWNAHKGFVQDLRDKKKNGHSIKPLEMFFGKCVDF